MKKWLLLCCFLLSVCFSSELNLIEKLATAEKGSYLVTEQNKTYTFLHVNAISKKTIVIEEVSVPASRFSQNPMPWRCWFEKGAPGHTSWLMSQINLETGLIEEIFSFTHQGWVDLSDSNSFLTTLLNLSFYPVPDAERRKIGLPPGYGKPDHRQFWNPRMVFEGKIIPEIIFSVWKARWPCDGTELSRKLVEIYLPDSLHHTSFGYPSYFPYWIEVEGKIGSAKVRVVDTGKGTSSPKGNLPLRSPKMIGENFTNEGLELYLNVPAYYQEFNVIAEEVDSFGKLFPLPCKTYSIEDKVCIFIPMEELTLKMLSGESYQFLISSKEHPAVCIETKKPFVFP